MLIWEAIGSLVKYLILACLCHIIWACLMIFSPRGFVYLWLSPAYKVHQRVHLIGCVGVVILEIIACVWSTVFSHESELYNAVAVIILLVHVIVGTTFSIVLDNRCRKKHYAKLLERIAHINETVKMTDREIQKQLIIQHDEYYSVEDIRKCRE